MTAKITKGKAKVKKIKLSITNVAYGAIGDGYRIGKVYDGEAHSSTKTKKSWSMDKKVPYSAGLVVYTYTNAYATILTKSGTYDLYVF